MTSGPEGDFPAPPSDGAEEIAAQEDGVNGDSVTPTEQQPDAVQAVAAEILTDVVALTVERDEYLSALQRSQADFANYRKRVLRQQEDQATRAALDLVHKLLPVLDTLDLALAHIDKAEPATEPTTEGQVLRQARSQLLDVLTKEGMERLDEAGVAFDPSVHDAVAHSESDEEDGAGGSKIDEVLRAGYRWRGQTLRPAMVRVRG